MKAVFRCATVVALLFSTATLVHAAPTLISFQEGVSPTPAYTHGATFIASGTPTTNYNASGTQSLLVGNNSTTLGFGPNGGARSLFEFDLSAIKAAAGNAQVQINDVSLVLFARGADDSAGSGMGNSISIDLRSLSTDFDETTITWNNATPIGGVTTGTVLNSLTFDPTPATGHDVTFGNTAAFAAAAQAAVDGPDGMLRFMAIRTGASASDTVYARFFYDETDASFDIGLKPELIISYSLVGVPEPSTLALMGVVIAGAGVWGVRRRWPRGR